MNALIPVTYSVIGGERVQSCGARMLHAFLEVKQPFSMWITDKIKQYGFVENQDFEVFQETVKNPSGGRPAKEFNLTLDMAKQLSMVEKNDRGRQAREYFLECERAAKQAFAHGGFDIPRTLPEALRLAADLADQNEKQRLQLVAAEPKVKFVDEYVDANGLYGLQNAGRALGVEPNKFIQLLKQHGYLHYQGKKLVPYAKHREKGIFEVKVEKSGDWAGYQTYVTPRGIAYFAHRLDLIQGKLKLRLEHEREAA